MIILFIMINTKEKGVFMLILKAIAIGSITGLTASIPLGPAGMESVKKSIDKGFFSGFQVSLGAVLADYIYIFLIHFGLARIFDINKHIEGIFWVFSGVLLFIFNKISKSSKSNSNNKINLNKIPGIFNGFLITFFNPSTPSIWIAMSGTILTVWESKGVTFFYVALASMFIATLIWFIILNLMASNGLKKFSSDAVTENASKAIYYLLYALSIGFVIAGLIKFFM